MKIKVTAAALEAAGALREDARHIADVISSAERDTSPDDIWHRLSRSALRPDIPYPVHRMLFDAVYTNRSPEAPPPPAWFPDEAVAHTSNIGRFCTRIGIEPAQLHRWSIENREAFWAEIIDALSIAFDTAPSRILGAESDPARPHWLPDASLNIARSCFGHDSSAPAILFQREGGVLSRMTYAELDRLSNRFANSLGAIGITRGDAIAIDMPMTVEAVAAYIGIVKAGCVVVSIADSFATDEIAMRLRIASAKAVVTQDILIRAGKTLPMYEKVTAARPGTTIVIPAADTLQRPLRPGDVSWSDVLDPNESFEPVACSPTDVTNVLFSSGTTGEPKAIPWTHATPIKCAMDGFLHHDIQPNGVVAWPTNLGWMMGPWLIYASLINRGTMALYYGAPGSREFCEFVQNAGVNMLGVVPSLVKAWRNGDTTNGLNWSSIKIFSSTGEASNADDYLYLMSLAGYRPVIEYCGGTEIGGGYITGTVTAPASPATFTTPAFGLDMYLLDEDGRPADTGEVFLVPPSIGLSETLLNKDHHAVYYEGTPQGPHGEALRRHGDQMERLPGSYYRAQGRADDTMNLGGIKVSSAEIERALTGTEGVSETAAIAVEPPGGGPSQLVVYAVPEPERTLDEEALRVAMQKAISTSLNPLFKLHAVVSIDALPRTASNKVMRRVLRDQYAAEHGNET